MNDAARCVEAVDRAVAQATKPVDADHAEVLRVLALFRSGQYRPENHGPEVRALARRFTDHPDPKVRQLAAALAEAAGARPQGGNR